MIRAGLRCSQCGDFISLVSKCFANDCPLNQPSETAMGKRFSDDPGLAEIKRMEYLMSKAPCLARLDELADWSEGKD